MPLGAKPFTGKKEKKPFLTPISLKIPFTYVQLPEKPEKNNLFKLVRSKTLSGWLAREALRQH